MRRLLPFFGLLFLSNTVLAGEVLSFGIVPQQAASKLATLWVPLLREVERRSGVRLWFHTAPDIPAFEQRLTAGEYDLAYMNPYHYTVFSTSPGYRAFAREQGKRIQGIVVVPKESAVTDVAQFQGSQLAFPAPAAFAASILPQASFERRGIAIKSHYVGSHDSVYRAVARGLFPAGGGVVRTFNNLEPGVRDKLRILWTTAGYTPHAFAAHPRIEPEVVARVAEALIGLGEDEAGRALLQGLNFKSMERASDGDWDDVRALNIRLLATPQPE